MGDSSPVLGRGRIPHEVRDRLEPSPMRFHEDELGESDRVVALHRKLYEAERKLYFTELRAVELEARLDASRDITIRREREVVKLRNVTFRLFLLVSILTFLFVFGVIKVWVAGL